MASRRFAWLLVAVAVGVAGWTALALGARSSYGNRTTGDEPHYLVTALSLAEDGDLTTADEVSERAYEPFHEQRMWNQATPLADGRLVEPHDPLLPVILAVPMGVGGWVAAKATLALLAGVLAAAMVWVAVRRFSVGPAPAAVTVVAFAGAMPLVAYGNQVYPELPAALAVVLAIGALTGHFTARGISGWIVSLVALPWLSVKYVPVALALALLGLVVLARRSDRRGLAVALVVLSASAVAYVGLHLLLYGGVTVYAAGSHFVEGGQLSVTGYEANYPGRSIRLVGLLVDRHFGLAAWAPVHLLAVPALAALARARPPGWLVLTAPLLAGWLNATYVAQTMHGWWSPGRQVVVVLPAVVLAVAWWIGRLPRLAWVVAGLGVLGAASWLWLVVEASTGRRTLVVDFFETTNPLYRAWSTLLPDGGLVSTDAAGLVIWSVVLAALAVAGWRSVAPSVLHARSSPREPRKEPNPCPATEVASLA